MILILSIILSLFVPSPWNWVVIGCGLILEVGEVVWGLRLAKRWRPKTGPETMIGQTAEVVTECRPTGQVRVRGELWEATCHAGADVGDTVRITSLESLDELRLVVAPVES
jgi:membrane-bound serine protease (ClpP class)